MKISHKEKNRIKRLHESYRDWNGSLIKEQKEEDDYFGKEILDFVMDHSPQGRLLKVGKQAVDTIKNKYDELSPDEKENVKKKLKKYVSKVPVVGTLMSLIINE